jgi:pimeloyl-ACP methyl ester carboxylesterase
MNKTLELKNDTIKYKEYWKDNENIILILHGWWWSSDSWIKVWKLLEKEKFRIIIPDLPWSTKTELDKSYTLENIAILVEEFVNKLKFKNIILWWHSNGWAITMKLASRKVINIKNIILNNSAWIRKDIKRNFKRRLLWRIVKIAKPLRKIKALNNIRTLFYKAIGSHDYIKSETNPHLKKTYLNMIDSDLQHEMKEINQNALLIRWEFDSYTPLSDAKKINRLIKKSKLIILDNERHGIHLDNPKRLVNIFLENN